MSVPIVTQSLPLSLVEESPEKKRKISDSEKKPLFGSPPKENAVPIFNRAISQANSASNTNDHSLSPQSEKCLGGLSLSTSPSKKRTSRVLFPPEKPAQVGFEVEAVQLSELKNAQFSERFTELFRLRLDQASQANNFSFARQIFKAVSLPRNEYGKLDSRLKESSFVRQVYQAFCVEKSLESGDEAKVRDAISNCDRRFAHKILIDVKEALGVENSPRKLDLLNSAEKKQEAFQTACLALHQAIIEGNQQQIDQLVSDLAKDGTLDKALLVVHKMPIHPTTDQNWPLFQQSYDAMLVQNFFAQIKAKLQFNDFIDVQTVLGFSLDNEKSSALMQLIYLDPDLAPFSAVIQEAYVKAQANKIVFNVTCCDDSFDAEKVRWLLQNASKAKCLGAVLNFAHTQLISDYPNDSQEAIAVLKSMLPK